MAGMFLLFLPPLKAYEHLEDEQALKLIEKLAENGRINQSPHPEFREMIEQVAGAAEAVLPSLRARVEEKRSGTTLLRPASAPTETKTLLRPTQEKPDREIATLPRIPTTEPANTETQHLLLKSDNGETTS
jgi:hypothetical protein